MLRPGDMIEYLADVSSPPNQKGSRGQTKVIDRDIPMWTANYLLRGGMIRPFDPASPLQIEEEESATADKTEKGPDGLAETKTEGKSAAADKKERSSSNNGQGKTNSGSDKAGDHGPEAPRTKRRTRNRRG